MEPKRCELCGRVVHKLERHHLIPRTRHKNKRNKKQFDRDDVRSRIAMLCPACHDQIHATFGQKELEHEYNTLKALSGHPAIRKFVRWLRRHPSARHVRVRRKGGNDLHRDQTQRRSRRKSRQEQREA